MPGKTTERTEPVSWFVSFEFNSLRDHSLEQVMRDLLYAFVGALLRDSMPGGIDVAWRTGQTIGPPNRGGIEHDVVLRTVIDSRGVASHWLAIDKGGTFGDNTHSW